MLLLAGTRPEAHKLAPLARALSWPQRCCWSAQHAQLPAETAGLDWLWLPAPSHPLGRRQLEHALQRAILGLLGSQRAAALVVQGDTATAHAGALAAARAGVPLVHLEAGLRSGDARSPFPEEIYRRRIAAMADLHLAPSARAVACLRAEGIAAERIRQVGSTAVDDLRGLSTRVAGTPAFDLLVDVHRRENAGRALQQLAQVLRDLADSGRRIGLLAHPNGDWCRRWSAALGPRHGVQRLPLLPRPAWLRLAGAARAVLSDSGGAAEELPYLGVPLLVYRHRCERNEAIEQGHALRIDPRQPACLAERIEDALDRRVWPPPWPFNAHSPYGDGEAGSRAAAAITEFLQSLPAGRGMSRAMTGAMTGVPA